MPDIPYKEHVDHHGELVTVGPYQVGAAGVSPLNRRDRRRDLALLVNQFDLAVCFNGALRSMRRLRVISFELKDDEAPPNSWFQFMSERVTPELEAGRRIVFVCSQGHDRTGMALSWLVAHYEPSVGDPVHAIRLRYCGSVVSHRNQETSILKSVGLQITPDYPFDMHG